MARTFAQVQAHILGDDYDSNKYRTRTRQAINDGLDTIARNVRMPKLETSWTVPVEAGVAGYALPADWIRLRSVHDSESRTELTEIDVEDIDQSSEDLGIPTMYAQYGGVLILFPRPVAAREIKARYVQSVAELDEDDDTVDVDIPEEYVFMIVAFGRSRLAAWEDDIELSSFWRNEFERMLQTMRSDIGRQSLRRTRQVPGMWAPRWPSRFRTPEG